MEIQILCAAVIAIGITGGCWLIAKALETLADAINNDRNHNQQCQKQETQSDNRGPGEDIDRGST